MTIRIGIGGWTFEPWRKTFYPEGLPHARELQHASRHVTSIEVNGTFYRTQTPKTFSNWADETPDNFVFSLKAPRYAVNRRVLGEAGPSIETFVKSGIAELGPKLGPILWQFAPTKKYDAEDFAAFMDLLPKTVDGLPLRHAIEVRHETFRNADFLKLLRKHNAALVYAHSDEYPEIADPTADFVYARLQQTVESEPAGYSKHDIGLWVERAKTWENGGAPDDLPLIEPARKSKPRDCFIYFISGAKVRNPHAAEAMIARLAA